MPLATGTRLGSYEILARIGAGGMGDVYRARDAKLKRLVAVKVLLGELANDPERRARLQHEAEVLAALNHPNIATIYGVEESTATVALVMELVEGRPLNEEIRAKGMPLERVLTLAVQIASGLEAAHRVGIVHRDLKPSNVMVTPTNIVKLVDFGLAKALEVSNPATGEAETIGTTPRTEEGQILGTVAYMSPEQAQGRPVDVRTDVFSFGTLLYEMFTGTKPFHGENRIATMSAILQQDPPLLSEAAGKPLPREAERLVLRCLKKDPDRRFQTVSDLRLALEDLREDSTTGRLGPIPAVATNKRWWPWAVATAAVLPIIAGVSYWLSRVKPAAPRTLQQLTYEAGIARDPALSPDGKLLAYASDRGGEGQLDIWLKQLAGGDAVRLTSGSGSKSGPQFSPDGTKIYFISGGEIFEVPTLGGMSRKVFEGAGPYAVSSRGEVAFYRPGTGTSPGPITILPTGGGAREAWHPECRSAVSPVWSPDGERILFAGTCAPAVGGSFGLYVAPRHAGSIQRIGESGLFPLLSRPAWFRLQNGREGVILAAPSGDSINLYRMSFDGEKEPVTQGTGSETWPVVSSSGEVIFTRAEETPAVWSLPLEGTRGPPSKEAAPARNFGTSPDGRKLVYGRMVGARRGQLVMRDRLTGTETVLATHDVVLGGQGSLWPQVSPDGTLIIYRALTRPPGQYLVSAEGGEPRLAVAASTFNLASDWSPDGKRVIGECAPTELPLPGALHGICDLDPATGKVRGLLKAPEGIELLYPTLSPDGKWVSFMRRRSGRTVICATPVRGEGVLAGEADWVQISPENADASRSRFSPDGSTIYYELRRAGVLILVKQKLDPATKRPLEEPIQLAQVEFSGSGQNLVTVTHDRVFFNTDEIRSNIWKTRLE